jgi:hypothetical protein
MFTVQTNVHQLTSNTTIGYTVNKPRSALETDKDPHTLAKSTGYQV